MSATITKPVPEVVRGLERDRADLLAILERLLPCAEQWALSLTEDSVIARGGRYDATAKAIEKDTWGEIIRARTAIAKARGQ